MVWSRRSTGDDKAHGFLVEDVVRLEEDGDAYFVLRQPSGELNLDMRKRDVRDGFRAPLTGGANRVEYQELNSHKEAA